MKVTSVGGGPGGLYTALLLAKADPGHDITVYERNAADDTFGWGVVFSAATLAELEDADAESYHRMMAASARWDPVEVVYGGARIRARGNAFAAISRKTLLAILQERCAELGVKLRFTDEVEDVTTHMASSDLVLAADGANSRSRERFAEHFGPKLTPEGGKFIWFGTTLPLDAFTFIFAQTDAGNFQVHSYPFSHDLSTFIVECDEESWRRAGLDATADTPFKPGDNDEHAIAFCQDLFADQLGGHKLLGNNSRWLDWHTVKCRSWYHENLALVGDSAHTAHFSIGSGTKLALEDAIALSRAVQGSATIPGALAAYESERRPAVDRLQEIAGESLDWFNRYHRYLHFEPPQFAYSLLSRSTRVTYENLRRRDTPLVHGFDQWFAAHHRDNGGQVNGGHHLVAPPPPALVELALGPTRLPNRIVVTPDTEVASTNGKPDEASVEELVTLGTGGAGLLLVEGVAVGVDARITPETPGLYTDEQTALWAKAVEAVHDGGDSLVGVQLLHAGARGSARPRRDGIDRPLKSGGWPLVAPSAVPYTRSSPVPAQLDRAGIEAVADAFVAAAENARTAGFDAVELQLGRGYLLGAFLSPLTNQRDDEYGGDFERRLAVPLEVTRRVREAVGSRMLLSACVNASDLQRGGISQDEAVKAVEALNTAGVDLFHVVAGQTTPRSRPEYGRGFHARWSDVVRNHARVPTLTSGDLPTIESISHVVAVGQADLCIIGRPGLEPTI